MKCDQCKLPMFPTATFEFTPADAINPDAHVARLYAEMKAVGVELDGKWEQWSCFRCRREVFRRKDDQ